MNCICALWNSRSQEAWFSALDEYAKLVKPSHKDVEKEMESLNINDIAGMGPEEWYEFLLKKYFFWKYTAPNRYATTTAQLKKYKTEPYGLNDLFLVKQKLLSFDKEEIAFGLEIARSIPGLGTAGASGLLALLFPTHFATVDQFVVRALAGIDTIPERPHIVSMKPENLTLKDAEILIAIMKRKAVELNARFGTLNWTPRRIDMVLWSVRLS